MLVKWSLTYAVFKRGNIHRICFELVNRILKGNIGIFKIQLHIHLTLHSLIIQYLMTFFALIHCLQLMQKRKYHSLKWCIISHKWKVII